MTARASKSAAAGRLRRVAPEWLWLSAGILVWSGVALTGLGIASVSQEMRNLVTELEGSQRAEDEMLAERSRLLLERSTLTSYSNIDRVAAEALSMGFPEDVERVEPPASLRPEEGGEAPP